MSKRRRPCSAIFIWLALPFVSMCAAGPWLLTQMEANPPGPGPWGTLHVGFIPWLEVVWVKPGQFEWSIKAMPVLAMVGISIAIIIGIGLSSIGILTWVKVLGRCLTCGYPIATSSERCPECGAAYSAPAQNSALGGVHRPLIGGLALLWTVPGLLVWFMMGMHIYVVFASMKTMRVPDVRLAWVVAIVLATVSVIASLNCLYRYRRSIAEAGLPSP